MYDLAIVGLGVAGLEALNIALDNNLNVIAFEENELGGTCLNMGCIPTKSILYLSNLYAKTKNNNLSSLSFCDVKFDWQEVIKEKDEIVQMFVKPLNMNLSKKAEIIKSKVEIIEDEEQIKLVSKEGEFYAKKLIISTGSIPYELPDLKFDGKSILSSDDIFKLESLPKSLTIVGSGAIGLEWAKILSDFGVNIKLVEKMNSLCPSLDIDIQKRVERILKGFGVDFYKNDYIVDYSNNKVTLKSNISFESDKILVAVGRKPNLPKITTIRKNDNIYLIGDVKGEIMLAHNSQYQAKSAMNKILFDEYLPQKNVPSVIYTTPEIASIGINEQDIEDKNDYIIKKLPIASIAKSWCDREHEGFIKLIIKNDIILGAHIISKDADSLISLIGVLIEEKIHVAKIKNMIFPHPSFCEIISEVLK